MKPRPSLRPYALLALAWLAFAAYVWCSSAHLPQRVAVHFGVNGVPNNWQTPAEYLRFMLLFGTLVPAFVLGTFTLIRGLNGWGLNIPHKDYWLAPERRQETFDYVQRRGTVMAGLMLAFFAIVHSAILAANAHTPVALRPTFFIGVGIFLVATLIWGITFTLHFRKTA
jgi:serine/threonine-protein kinase